MSSLSIAGSWLRRQLTWSNSRRSWYERLGVLALAGLAAAGWWVSPGWSLESRLLLLGAWLVLLALLMRRGLIRLFGPVFFFELLRGSRQRVHLFRALYALILLVAISYVYLIQREIVGYVPANDLKAQAEVAFTAFVVYFCIQLFVVAAFLTPIMIAGCIAEDKERRTLEFVLATDLRSREIVLGKLAGRLAGLIFILLAGLPVLSFLQFLGGIPPDLLLVSFAVTAVTLLSVAALSLWHSVMLKRARDAIVLTYLSMVAYLALSGAARLLLALDDIRSGRLHILGRTITGEDFIDAVGAGNPFVHLGTILQRMDRTDVFMDVAPDLLQEYVIFHVLVIVVGITWATLRLRPIALLQAVGESRRKRPGRKLPAIGRWPMMWKELFVETRARFPWLLRVLVILAVFGSFVPPVLITQEYANELLAALVYPRSIPQPGAFPYRLDPWEQYGLAMNAWVRAMTGIVGTILLLAVAVRAAGSVSGERSRRTLDELLTTPLTNEEIVGAKWLGSIVSVRLGWLWLGIVLACGLLSGGLSFVGLALTVFAWLAYASLMAALGILCSIANRSTFRATLAALVLTLIVLFGHWLAGALVCYLPMAAFSAPGDFVSWLAALEVGFTPSLVLGAAPIRDLQELYELPEEALKFIVFAFVGCFTYLAAAAVLNRWAVYRFAREFNRADKPLPPRKPAAQLFPAQSEVAPDATTQS